MPARKRRRRKDEQAPGWAWLLVGLSLGLIVALVVYLQGGTPERVAAPTAAAPLPRPTPIDEPEPATTAEIEAPAEASDRSSAAPEFEFWELLREFEIIVPESRDAPRAAAAAEPTADGQYLIQAGSFRRFADADQRRANLALLGIEAQIYPADVGNEVYHRVMIGPLTGRADFDRVMRRLAEAGIESLPRSRIN